MTHTRTQQIKRAFEDWKKSNDTELWHVYGRFSYAKNRAFEYCEHQKQMFSGYGLKIISHNTFSFSVGFIGIIDNKEAFIYITKDNDRYIFINELEG
jgi:hypothetical protein